MENIPLGMCDFSVCAAAAALDTDLELCLTESLLASEGDGSTNSWPSGDRLDAGVGEHDESALLSSARFV